MQVNVMPILKGVELEGDDFSLKLSVNTRRQLFGSLGSTIGRQVHRVCNLGRSGYRAPNICKSGEDSYCKTAEGSLRDLLILALYALRDKRVIKDKALKEYVLTVSLTDEEVKKELLDIKTAQYKEFIENGSLIEDYRETACGRLYHPIQNEKKELRNEIVKHFGFNKNIDVKSCMPTIMHQHILGEQYDSQTIDDITTETGIERQVVKKWINSRFYKGCPESKHSNVFKDFDCDWRLSTDLKLKSCKKYNNLAGKIKEINRKCKNKYTYFIQERLVTNCFYDFIKSRGGRTILIHDGFYTDIDFDLKELEYYITERTGFKLKLEQENI